MADCDVNCLSPLSLALPSSQLPCITPVPHDEVRTIHIPTPPLSHPWCSATVTTRQPPQLLTSTAISAAISSAVQLLNSRINITINSLFPTPPVHTLPSSTPTGTSLLSCAFPLSLRHLLLTADQPAPRGEASNHDRHRPERMPPTYSWTLL